jgi:hypothetical protein
METMTINWLAVIAAALSSFLLGGLWYSPLLFAKAWQRANGFTDKQVKGGNLVKIFGFSFVFSFIMALNLAMFLSNPETDISWGIMAGFLAGFGWSFMSIGITAMFERRSWSYIFINGGYQVLALVLMGAILGAWRP